ncbi:SDR family NAD(P)-dependent oxidoreductase [Rothia sp. LK2588]|uniref:SDR family NAD(P)-dependent oxidoreductase n=1 Tax=Rothia sp. LK2588 TaxID=3114369 RepID=UPI0034CFC432
MSNQLSNSYVLITGASSGIGAEFARAYASEGYSLVLTARREQALAAVADEVRSRYGVQAEILLADLGRQEDVQKVVERLRSQDAPVEVLINNAGFGLGSSFHQATTQKHLHQVDILARVPLQLMHTAIETMLPRRRGKIINVASVAAFTPGGTYSAVKRFLVSLSQSANAQYSKDGLLITAVCPGLTRSDFHQNMGQSEPNLPRFFWLSPEKVVADAIAANNDGRAVCVPSAPYKVLVALSRILPSKVSARAIQSTRDY